MKAKAAPCPTVSINPRKKVGLHYVETTKKRVLLVDADVLAYQACAGTEKVICFDDDNCFPLGSLAEALSSFDYRMAFLKTTLKADEAILCFSGDTGENFRRGIYPAYKANRLGKPKPVALAALRNTLINERGDAGETVMREPALEADDLLGILSSRLRTDDTETVVVSIDKDLRSIPGLFFNIGRPEEGIQEITPEEADRWFMMQTLMGDMTDNYPGCPRFGPATAARALNDVEPTPEAMWPVVVDAYARAGFGEEYALTMARLARILREGEYDFNTKKVTLWEP